MIIERTTGNHSNWTRAAVEKAETSAQGTLITGAVIFDHNQAKRDQEQNGKPPSEEPDTQDTREEEKTESEAASSTARPQKSGLNVLA